MSDGLNNNSDNVPKHYFTDNLQYNAYLVTPDSKETFPELNKDISLSDLKVKWQRVILLKGRVADYIRTTFKNCSNPDNSEDKYLSNSYMSFIRDIMAVGVTSQGLNGRLLRQITENNTKISHSYNMDEKYKKNIGD